MLRHISSPPAGSAPDTSHVEDTKGYETGNDTAHVGGNPKERQTKGKFILRVEVCHGLRM